MRTTEGIERERERERERESRGGEVAGEMGRRGGGEGHAHH